MQVQSSHSRSSLTVMPLHPTIGAEIGGVDLRYPLTDELRDAIRALLIKHRVIFFRDQNITRDQHRMFARSFGELKSYARPDLPDFPEIERIYAEPGQPSLPTNVWHSDWSSLGQPTMGTVLRGVDIPDVGGDTLFADMIAAYRGLPEEVRERIDDLKAVHNIGGAVDINDSAYQDYDKSNVDLSEFEPHEHPIVRTHPESGEKILYVNSLFTSHIVGLPREEGEKLLAYLCARASIPEYQVRFRWRKHSIAFWDNRSVQHYASADYRPAIRRVEAISIQGDKPF